MAGSPRKRARQARAAAAADPLDERYVEPRKALATIPWNKVELSLAGHQAVVEALLAGYPRSELAKALDISLPTLKRLIDDDPRFLEAVEMRKDAEEAELKDLLMDMARKGDTAAGIFLAKAQFGWRERDDPKAAAIGNGGGLLVIPASVPLDEWSLAAERQQQKYREAPQQVIDQMADREREVAEAERREAARGTGTAGLEGLRLVKPKPGELST